MKNITVSIMEEDAVYGQKLAAYISQHEGSPFTVHLYLEHPAGDDGWQQADIIVVSAALKALYGDKGAGRGLLILDEDGKGEHEEAFVYKYQSAAAIYESLLNACMDAGSGYIAGNGRMKKEFVVMAVYTPIGGEQVTRHVLDICRQMAEQSKLLYMNLEQVSVFWELLGERDRQEGVSDLIYYVKQQRGNIGTRIAMLAVKGDFDYLLPAATPIEIAELGGEDWKYCLDCICYETDYEKVVFDFGTSVPPAAVLDACTKLVIVSGNDAWSERLICQFRGILERLTDDNLAEKIDMIDMGAGIYQAYREAAR